MRQTTRVPRLKRRLLYLQISSLGDLRQRCRAERVLMRGLARRWPEARLEQLLALLLERGHADHAAACRGGQR